MKNLKKILALALALCMVLALAACGGSSSSGSASSGSSSSGSASSGSASSGSTASVGDDWKPSGTVSIIVPAGAGGDTDLTARVFAEYAKKLTGVDFIVVNANGASGSIAANQVRDAAADGCTFLYGHTLVNMAYMSGISDYNYTEFVLGPNFAKNPAQQLYVNPAKYASLDDFLAAAKANPGTLKACTEVGAYTYYELLDFEKKAGIDLDLVDVGSNSEKVAAMLSGEIDLMPGAWLSCKGYVENGDFFCLGLPAAERSDLIPDIPTFVEQGIADFVYPDCDYSFYFPAGTDAGIITWYENLVQQILADPDAQQAISDITVIPYYMSAADCQKNEETMMETLNAIVAGLEQ